VPCHPPLARPEDALDRLREMAGRGSA
jgi:hypothetical protein